MSEGKLPAKDPIVEAIGGFAITLLSSRGGEPLKGGVVYGPTHAIAAAADLATMLMTPSLLQPHLDAAARKHGVANILTGEVPPATPSKAEAASSSLKDEIAPKA